MVKNNESNFRLAIETSGRSGSVAIGQGQNILRQLFLPGTLGHSANLLATITKLLEEFNLQPEDIGRLYLSIGPGSFTGLRIGVTFAKIMALAQPKIKITTADTLEIIAMNFMQYQENNQKPADIASIIDAKRGRFYIATFRYEPQRPNITRTSPDMIIRADKFLELNAGRSEPLYLMGEGLLYYKERFNGPNTVICPEPLWQPCASNCYAVADAAAGRQMFENPLTLKPKYLTDPDAKPKTDRP